MWPFRRKKTQSVLPLPPSGMLPRREYTLAELVKDYRKRCGLTQEQLGKRIGRSKPWVVDLERGKAAMSVETAKAISSVLELPIEQFAVLVVHHEMKPSLQEILKEAGLELYLYSPEKNCSWVAKSEPEES